MQGYDAAQASLGLMYRKGWGVPQDYAQAMFWYRRAADQGNAEAEVEIGAMHQNGSDPNLWVMPAGSAPTDPAGLLGRQLGPQVFSALPQPHVFIVDTPAQAVFPDALVIAVQCDATILVVDPRLSRRRAVRATIRQLSQVNARLIGVVMNRTASPGRQYGAYHYRYRRSGVRVPSRS